MPLDATFTRTTLPATVITDIEELRSQTVGFLVEKAAKLMAGEYFERRYGWVFGLIAVHPELADDERQMHVEIESVLVEGTFPDRKFRVLGWTDRTFYYEISFGADMQDIEVVQFILDGDRPIQDVEWRTQAAPIVTR